MLRNEKASAASAGWAVSFQDCLSGLCFFIWFFRQGSKFMWSLALQEQILGARLFAAAPPIKMQPSALVLEKVRGTDIHAHFCVH